ncbi:hypothetical protein [Thalassobius sp. Cn5-15]|uniref:hypothetical protein n=1 Tax=Thalassobius sp. Cn5-15 TaxID=2917763 RepID=UPI001EF1EE9A|nr:hypothetical protein [Thalassobius sp. Cn5-15]MCG7493208.1 hypothetical protein [Thalassobius sp. Cn5-15]
MAERSSAAASEGALSALLNTARQPGSLKTYFVVLLLLLMSSVNAAGWKVTVTKEIGAFEEAAFISLALATLLSGYIAVLGGKRFISVPLFTGFLALRELDFHNWWFEPGVLHIGIFSAPVPLWQKGVSAALMLVILLTAIHLIWAGSKPALRALRAGEPWARVAFLGLVSGFFGSQLDGLKRNLVPYGIEISDWTHQASMVLEETLEFGFAFATLSAVVFYARRHIV